MLAVEKSHNAAMSYTAASLALLSLAIFFFLFNESFVWMYGQWTEREEFSHGMIIPMVSLYLIWTKLDRLVHSVNSYNWAGLLLLLFGLAAFFVADMATIFVGVILSALMCLYGAVIMTLGWKNTKEISAPLLILLFMVPMPAFINNNMSNELQLISSQLGVAFIRLFDITVYLEGNIIDLGSYKLQVVDACSGLRYLYPLVALGFILVYMCDIKLWMKAVVFISTIPITVVMNSIRVGAIGVSVEYWGPEMAEGLLHDVEGWFMFMASLFVVLIELVVLLRLTGDKRKLQQVLLVQNNGAGLPFIDFKPALKYAVVGFLILLVALAYAGTREVEDEIIPDRMRFNHFPLFLGEWRGTPDIMEQHYVDALKFDDYILADYRKGDMGLNFYVAYYGSQRKGSSAHSPRSCIPGGGWQIKSLEQIHLDGMYLNSQPLMVNRLQIQKGDFKQAVYYWFNQRGRLLTNEYLVKWYLFQDALFENRTDGALIRLTVPLGPNEGFDKADRVVTDFLHDAYGRLADFIPGSDLR